ncbi:ribonuclease T [Granulicella sp. WH15]|uniref:ribonuclease T2 family protein n=1 Tax=Granulicella sp. WH15 TaxID=2602070 RepID=UPI0013673818|nr:ribonuclease T [Granulicella sp. WH15]QHN02659.1 ribonuclease T [Granulicella sp. WH15]
MRLITLCLLLFGLFAQSLIAQAPAQPDHFDYYLLNLSWSPEFCATLSSSPQCAAHPGFVLHGLWPQNRDGSWPANCDNHEPGPTDPSAWLDITPDLSLIAHEWSKHGTCTLLSGDAFFAQARKAYRSIVIPPLFSKLDHEIAMKPDAIVNLFLESNPSLSSENLNLSCGNNRLTAMEVCLNKDLQPTGCTALRKCRANVVKITPMASASR